MSVGGSGSGVGSGSANQPQCCTDQQLDDLLGKGLDGIINALDKINQTLDSKLKFACDQIDECIDKIEAALDKKYKGKTKTADECRRLALAGKDGTLEYAITCAGSVYKECTAGCSPGDGKKDGDCCSGCGQTPCCCKDNECVQCPTETPRRFKAWCNSITHVYAVTPESDPSPGQGFAEVALTDTESEALSAAQIACPQGTQQNPPPTPIPASEIPPFVNSLSCYLPQYMSAGSRQTIIDRADSAKLMAGMINATKELLSAGQTALGLIGPLGAAEQLINGVFSSPMVIAKLSSSMVARALGCSDSGFQAAYETLAPMSYIARLTGMNLSTQLAPFQYVMNAACRNNHLGPSEAMSAFMANGIDFTTLDTHWAINGLCPESVRWSIEANRSKPIPREIATMRLREQISQQEYQSKMRAVGYTNTVEQEQLFKLTEQLPTMSDIIRMMVRDSDDEALAKQFGLDDNFTDKYQKQLKDWSKHQGIPEKFAQYMWRAHWSIPSPGQLFEFWHRLRNNPAFGGKDKVLEDIKAALIQQDILPYWHESYLAVSFLPLGRIDIRRAFNTGSMTESELTPAYEQLGYSDDDVKRLVKFAIRLRDQAAKTHPAVKNWIKGTIDRAEAVKRMVDYGYPEPISQQALTDSEHGFISSPFASAFLKGQLDVTSLEQKLKDIGVTSVGSVNIAYLLGFKVTNHIAAKNYATGMISRNDALDQMKIYGVNPDVAEEMLTTLDQSVEMSFVLTCQRGIKKRYLLGELDKASARSELVTRGTVLERANKLVDWWDCERSAGSKHVTAAILCKWLNRGVIDTVEMSQRLEKLGYDKQDADKIVGDCLLAMNSKQIANAQKQAKQQAAFDLRRKRLLDKANADVARQAAQLERARSQQATIKARRETQLLSAAQKHNKVCNCDLIDSLRLVRDNYNRIRQQYGLTVDEGLQVVIKAAESYHGPTGIDYDLICNEFSEEINGVSLTPPIDFDTGQVLTNGFTQPS